MFTPIPHYYQNAELRPQLGFVGFVSGTGVAEDQAIYSTEPNGAELVRDIHSGKIREETVTAMWPIIQLLNGE